MFEGIENEQNTFRLLKVHGVSAMKPIVFINFVLSEHQVNALACWWLRNIFIHPIIVIKSEWSTIIHWLGLGHEAMLQAARELLKVTLKDGRKYVCPHRPGAWKETANIASSFIMLNITLERILCKLSTLLDYGTVIRILHSHLLLQPALTQSRIIPHAQSSLR